MNFFEHQHQARQRSALLVTLFVLSVLIIVVIVDLVVAGITLFVTHNVYDPYPAFGDWLRNHPRVIGWTSAAVLVVIAAAAMYRMAVLRQGGGAVARLLGGTRIDAATTDPQRRQLVNVIEETAIAAGLPVPEIYVLETEPGINALAAGFTPSDAAIAVTRGALETLTRDELQGVIAHEFSHILHGDTRLNMRLLGITFGIMVIALAGQMILRTVGHARGSRDGRAAVGALIFGLSLFIAGYLGVLAARLIKAALSRNRESLADASAVQFTRNPSGLAGALKKIAASPLRASIVAAQQEEVSHMLIAERTNLFDSMFASHPPILDRIRALDPAFRAADLASIRLQPMRLTPANPVRPPPPALPELFGLAPHIIVGLVGQPAPSALASAAAIDAGLAPALRDAAHSAQDAIPLVLAMVLNRDGPARRQQLDRIAERIPDAPIGLIENLSQQVNRLDAAHRLPLIEMAFPALRQRPDLELRTLVGLVDDLVAVDGNTRVFDYALSRLLRQLVAEHLSPRFHRPTGRRKLIQLQFESQTLFSMLAFAGHADVESATAAYTAGWSRLFPRFPPHYAPPQPWIDPLDRALLALDELPPLVKQELVDALSLTVLHDRQITLAETELLRAICALLHCPLPPLLPSAASDRRSGLPPDPRPTTQSA